MQSVVCRIGGMQDWWTAGKKGCRKEVIQEKREAGNGEIQTRCKMVDLLKLIVESVSRVGCPNFALKKVSL